MSVVRALPCLILLLVVSSLSAQSAFYPDKQNLMVYLEAGKPREVKTPADWQRRRAHILENLQLVMGPMPGEDKRVPLDLRVDGDGSVGQCRILHVSYASEAGDRVPAYLFLPQAPGRYPAMLCLHQTTGLGKGEPAGVGGSPALFYARELALRGYVTLAPDYPGYGEYKIDPYEMGYVSATMKGLWNHRRALDLLQSLPHVDGERIGCIGHSLGGHNTLFLAAFDERIKVAVSSGGFTALSRYMGGNLAGWSHKGYMPRIQERYGADPARLPFDFTEILGAIAPRAVFINAPVGDTNFDLTGVKECVQAAQPVYGLLGKPEGLAATYPDCGHDFPDAARQAAYQFIDSVLRR